MLIIYKYSFEIANVITFTLPFGAKILHLDVQCDIPHIWPLVDTDKTDIQIRNFKCFGTGHPITNIDNLKYIGTIKQYNDAFIWHIFEAINE